MRYISTRGAAPTLTFADALFAGLASDGGLYVPERFPKFDITGFSSDATLPDVGARLLAEFVDEQSGLKEKIASICARAMNFRIPVVRLDESTSVLELYHGPTAAFKDVGARFLAECIATLDGKTRRTVLVATSGDTGGAVAGAFHQKPGIEVVILFPKGMVSEFQERQLTCWGDNVRALGVRGTFDDCQRLVKEAFLHPDWKQKNLLSANSINIGRILPQAVYYAWASLSYFQKTKKPARFIIPSGNLGNSLAALWAKKMGFPIAKIILACNSNRTVLDFFETGHWRPRPSQTTLANAMDVGNPSNFERLRHLYPDLESLKKDVEAISINDDEIKKSIRDSQTEWNRVFCPHTATAVAARRKLTGNDWIIVATAHAAKFKSVVEPLIDGEVALPPSLEKFEKREPCYDTIEPELARLSAMNSEPT